MGTSAKLKDIIGAHCCKTNWKIIKGAKASSSWNLIKFASDFALDFYPHFIFILKPQ